MDIKPGQKNKKFVIYFVVVLIITLQLINIFLIYKNNQIIEHNKSIQEKAEQIKVNASSVIRYLHQVDVGLRGYALTGTMEQLDLMRKSYAQQDSILSLLETTLSEQNFPMQEFYELRDTLTWYFSMVSHMEELVRNNKTDTLNKILRDDPGYYAWADAVNFSNHVNDFEDRIARRAELEYQQALEQSYIFQIILLLITAPVLSFTGYYIIKTLNISEKLRQSENEKNQILAQQKENLEKEVNERTYEIQAQNEEIQAQNEEIQAQNEEIRAHNDQLVAQQKEIEKSQKKLKQQNQKLTDAKNIIEHQSQIIKEKNTELEKEVTRQTQDLKKANTELIEKNSRLEQFTYIISHNLRSPVARIFGLSDLLPHSANNDERNEIVRRMVNTTHELNQTLIDLKKILDIQKINTNVFSEVDLDHMTDKVLDTLEVEIKETATKISRQFKVNKIYSLSAYIESILHNLITNAIKYRHPDRSPHITIKSYKEQEWVIIDITDNGLGINTDQHKDHLFNLYKRFHFHVKGKGMGLYLVKSQVQALGGKIDIRSKENKGTSFYIYLNNNLN